MERRKYKIRKTNDISAEAISFNEFGGNYIIDEVDFGTVDIERESYSGYKQLGVTETGFSVQSRDIAIHGFIVREQSTKETMRKLKNNLKSYIVYNKSFYVYVDDSFYIEVFPDQIIQFAADFRKNNEQLVEYQISGIAAFPLFQDVKLSVEDFFSYKPQLHFPLYSSPIVFGAKKESEYAICDNRGDVEAGMVITLTSRDRTVNPHITFTDDEQIGFLLSLNKGDELIIDTRYGEKTAYFNGESCIDKVEGEWINFPMLQPGKNIITLSAASGADNLAAHIEYRCSYFEV